jgi:hypothetical protein
VLDGNSQPGHDPSPAFDDMSEEELGAEKAKVHHYLKGIGSTCWRFYMAAMLVDASCRQMAGGVHSKF